MSMTLFDLTGRRALVSGASRGLGLQMAGALARAGADLVITARDVAALEEPPRRQMKGVPSRKRCNEGKDHKGAHAPRLGSFLSPLQSSETA